MKRVRYLTPAVHDLQRAIDRLERGSDRIARGFTAEYLQALEDLRAFPQMAPVLEGPVRKKVLAKYPFSVLYYVKDDHVVVVAVMHHRQHPDFWKSRTDL